MDKILFKDLTYKTLNIFFQVIFINLLIACSSHVINKRSLLGGHETHGHHGHHQHHHHQRQQARTGFGRRVGRDGGHHHDESENEIR